VNLLRNCGTVVRLVVEREEQEEQSNEQLISVVLDKSINPSIGLSLAKRVGHDGIFIRSIAPGSSADKEGSLRVGDKLFSVNGKEILNEHTTEIVERLQQVSGKFELTVKRTI
jgi:S1-C subfamily serine protease